MYYTYGCKTLTAALIVYLHLQNHCVTLHIRVSKLKAAYVGWLYFRNQWLTLHLCTFCLLCVLTESLSFNTLIIPPS